MRVLFYIAFFLFNYLRLYSVYYYPYEISKHQAIEHGEILKIKDDYFLLNYGLLGESSMLYKIDPNSLKKINGISFDKITILKSAIDDDYIYLLAYEFDTLNLIILENLKIKFKIQISDKIDYIPENIDLIINNNLILVQIDKSLYLLDILNKFPKRISLISQNAISANFFQKGDQSLSIALIEDNQTQNVLKFLNLDGKLIHSIFLPFYDNIKLIDIGSKLIVFFNSKGQYKSLVYILNKDEYTISSRFWINSSIYLTYFDKNILFFIETDDNNFALSKIDLFNNFEENSGKNQNILPYEFIEPLFVKKIDKKLIIVFKNGLCVANTELNIELSYKFHFNEWISEIKNVFLYNNKIIVSSRTNSIIFNVEPNKLWFLKFLYAKYGQYFVLIILGLVFLYLINKIRIYKKLLKIITEIHSDSFLFIINHKGKLTFSNEFGSKLLSISSNIPYNRLFKDYFKNESFIGLYEFYENSVLSKKTTKEKISLIIDGNLTEWLCTLIPIRNFRGYPKGFILTGIDITEQLERKRLANWAQLAHDMQTNLSTIKLNAEHLDSENCDNIRSRQKKILHQVNILMNRIRDIITVGRSDKLELQKVNSFDLFYQAISEFDEEIFPNVKFNVDVDNFELNCDKNKLIRAIRNAIENGIRALPNKTGEILLKAKTDGKFAYLSIKDNGFGMDEDTKSKFLKPYFTTSSHYGGSGIGTIIIQKVVELHNGSLRVESKINEGTEITLILPTKLSN